MIVNIILKWLEKFKDEKPKGPIGHILQINFQKDENVKTVNYAVTNNPDDLHAHWVIGDKVMLLCLDGSTININMSRAENFQTIPIQDHSDLLDLAFVRKSVNENVLGIPPTDVIRSWMNG